MTTAPDRSEDRLILGRTRAQWLTVWEYDRWKIIASVLGLAMLGYLVLTAVSNRPPDFQIVAIGQFTPNSELLTDQEIAQAIEQATVNRLSARSNDIQEADFERLPLTVSSEGVLPTTTDGPLQQAMLMKITARFSADALDVVLFDQGTFRYFSPHAEFTDLDPLADLLSQRLDWTQQDQITWLFAPTGQRIGLDVSQSDLLDAVGLKADSLIITIGPRCRQPELAFQWVASWLTSSAS